MKRHIHRVTSVASHIHEHIIAFAIAVFVIAGIGSVFLYRDTLFADITGAGGQGATIEYASPLVYSLQNGLLRVSTTKQLTDATSISFLVFFDPQKILLSLEKAASEYTYTYAPGGENMVQVTIIAKGTVPENTILYQVPVDGSIENITIANAGIMWGDVFETVAIQKQ